jgi:aconitate hydratase
MKMNLTRKILSDHLVEGELTPGAEIGLRIDHTLLQDATGTLAMLEFEALGLPAIKA